VDVIFSGGVWALSAPWLKVCPHNGLNTTDYQITNSILNGNLAFCKSARDDEYENA
jgi:hypothetical protein